MAQLKNLATGQLIEVTEACVYDADAHAWRCGEQMFLDFSGDGYEAVGVSTSHRLKVSRVEFKQLLTAAERIAIRTARAYVGSNPQALAIKAGLDDLFDILEDPALTHVDLSLPTTQGGVTLLAQAGLIAPERVAQILQGWVE